MNLGDTLLLGVNTTIVCMVIVFVVLIVLAVIIVLQSKILKLLSNHENKKEDGKRSEVEVKHQDKAKPILKEGLIRGEARIAGLEDEESAAVIMAAVSEAANIPLTSLRIKSIKRIDSTLKNS